MEKTEILVVGAGVAGLSTALHLAKHRKTDITVLEGDARVGGHASGRNAGMIRQAVSDPALAALAIEGRRALFQAGRRGWKGLGFRRNGSLLLASDAKGAAEIAAIRTALVRNRLNFTTPSRKAILRRVPVLGPVSWSQALFCPSDAMIEIGPLLDGFLSKLRDAGVKVRFGEPIRAIERVPGGFQVSTSGRPVLASVVVNAAGAWASKIGEKAGATRVPLPAYRRHLYESPAFGRAAARWPFVWDLSRQLYFRPTARGLLLSPCDKVFFRPGPEAPRSESVDPRMRGLLLRKLKAFSSQLASVTIGAGRSGLRTVTPDGRFVIGEDPALPGFFWVAGLGGHGVTTCFSVGKLAAALITGRPTDAKLARALSPARFLKGTNAS